MTKRGEFNVMASKSEREHNYTGCRERKKEREMFSHAQLAKGNMNKLSILCVLNK